MPNISDELTKLGDLLERGLVTSEEFESMKQALLRQWTDGDPATADRHSPKKSKRWIGVAAGLAAVVLAAVAGFAWVASGRTGDSSTQSARVVESALPVVNVHADFDRQLCSNVMRESGDELGFGRSDDQNIDALGRMDREQLIAFREALQEGVIDGFADANVTMLRTDYTNDVLKDEVIAFLYETIEISNAVAEKLNFDTPIPRVRWSNYRLGFEDLQRTCADLLAADD